MNGKNTFFFIFSKKLRPLLSATYIQIQLWWRKIAWKVTLIKNSNCCAKGKFFLFSFKGHYKSTRNRNKFVCKHVSRRQKCFILHCKHEMYTKVEKCSKSILLSSLKCNKKLKIKIHFLKPQRFFHVPLVMVTWPQTHSESKVKPKQHKKSTR